ncbi:MAG: LysR family transcriptional regulator [Rhizobiales bacterium]|nr:LysR family transcriptional regulator [Hyphomicrobiales bacterium]
MPIRNIDNLRIGQFKLFKEIYELGSLSEAAENLNITQSSASKQLKQLREHFGDDLFVRTSNGMQPTNRAKRIMSNIQNIMNEVDNLYEQGDFNPKKINTRFAISMADELQCFLIPKLMERIGLEAPNVRIALCLHDKDYAARQLEDGSVKLVIAVNCTAPEHLTQSMLYSDDFVCLMRKNHLFSNARLDLHDYINANHLSVISLTELSTHVDRALSATGYKRHIKLVIPTFIQAENILVYSDHILTLPRRMANQLASHGQLAVKELPMKVEKFHYYQYWHKRYNKDPARIWLKNIINDILSRN